MPAWARMDIHVHQAVVIGPVNELGIEPRLLPNLAAGGGPRRFPGLDMAARLKPEAEPLVPVEQQPPGSDDHRRPCDMDGAGVLGERFGKAVELAQDPAHRRPFPLVEGSASPDCTPHRSGEIGWGGHSPESVRCPTARARITSLSGSP